MVAEQAITSIRVAGEFHACPSCGYERGFHTSFCGMEENKAVSVKSTREVFRVILICPECGARYDVGWRVSFSEPENKFVKTTVLTDH